MMFNKTHTLIIAATDDKERYRINIPVGARVKMYKKVFNIYLIKGVYHYTFKGVSFYQSKDIDTNIILILGSEDAYKCIQSSKKQKNICRLIKSRMLRHFYKEENNYDHFSSIIFNPTF